MLIGGEYKEHEKQFRSSRTGELLTYFHWNEGEPNNYDGIEDCIEMYTDTGKWNDVYCIQPYAYSFVCDLPSKCCVLAENRGM